jgi:hypothetical protein
MAIQARFFLVLVLGVLLPACASTPATTSELNLPPANPGDYMKLAWDQLAGFPFKPIPYDPAKDDAPPSSADQMPDAVKQLEGRKVLITGFMLPLKTDTNLATDFLLVSPRANAGINGTGPAPSVNEWVVVSMPKGARVFMDLPVACFGTLHVKDQYDSGNLTGIYELEGDAVTKAKP